MVGFFDESEGVRSSTRLMTVTAALGGIAIAIASVFLADVTIGDALPMVIALLGYSMGQKIGNKWGEN